MTAMDDIISMQRRHYVQIILFFGGLGMVIGALLMLFIIEWR